MLFAQTSTAGRTPRLPLAYVIPYHKEKTRVETRAYVQAGPQALFLPR